MEDRRLQPVWGEDREVEGQALSTRKVPDQTARCYGTNEVVGEVQGGKGFTDNVSKLK